MNPGISPEVKPTELNQEFVPHPHPAFVCLYFLSPLRLSQRGEKNPSQAFDCYSTFVFILNISNNQYSWETYAMLDSVLTTSHVLFIYVLSIYIARGLTMHFSKHVANVNPFNFYSDLMTRVL